MKRCPQCQRTYEDAKNFCLQDGTPLVADAPPPQPPPPQQNYQPDTSPFQSQPTQPGPPSWSQAGSWQPPPNLSAPTARKRSAWPWVLGILGVLVVGTLALVGGLGYFLYRNVKPTSRVVVKEDGRATKNADTETYVNSREHFSGQLAEHYSDFSFEYPSHWQLKEPPGSSDANFVKVERTEDGTSTLENFAVGWYTSTGTMQGDAQLFPQLARQLSTQFSTSFRGYRKVSEGRTRVGSHDGYEFRFAAKLEGGGRSVDLYGRAVMIPSGSTTQRNGVALIMLATSLAPGIKSAADVGVKGELPVILDSFRLGAAATAASDDADATETGEAATAADEAVAAAEAVARGVAGGGDSDAPTDRRAVLAQLTEIEEEWARANAEADKEALARILADEYVGTAHDGVTERKAEYIKNIKPSTEIASPQEFENLKLVLAGGRAILTGVTAVEFKDGRTGRFRFVDIFVWRDGRWQAVTSTSSEVK